jgi:guanine deaminase
MRWLARADERSFRFTKSQRSSAKFAIGPSFFDNPDMDFEQRREFLRHAVRLSAERMRDGAGGPFGAIVVKDGEVIAEGWNRVTSTNDPTAHAEMTAIRRACEALATFSLKGCEIFTSCEPCPMCLAAIYWARLDRITFANSRADAAAIGFDDELIYAEVSKPVEHRLIPTTRLALPEADAVFAEWRANPDKIPY